VTALDSPILNQITGRLVAEFEPEEVLLFGSWAWGQPDASSDVDLLVVVTASDEAPVRRARRAYRCLNGIGVPVDVLVKTRDEVERFRDVKASLEHKIFEEGKVLYERRSQTRVGEPVVAESPA
jgi:predicted nucleotidyltransferase